jgi:hypothetical protein
MKKQSSLSKSPGRTGRRSFCAIGLVCVMLLQACGDIVAPPLPVEAIGRTAQAETAEQTAERFVSKKLLDDIAQTAAFASFFTGVGSALGVVIEILHFTKILQGNPDESSQKIDALSRQLDAIAGALSWQYSTQERERRLADGTAAAINAGEVVRQTGKPLRADAPAMLQSITAVQEAEQPTAFKRLFSDAATDGDGWWKNTLEPKQVKPIIDDHGFVYDWRLGVPSLMMLIAFRLQVIAASDPNFVQNGTFKDELIGYRNELIKHQRQMLDGVRCNTAHGVNLDGSVDYVYGCADIYTGLSDHGWFRRWTTDTQPQDDALALQSRNEIYLWVLHHMPFFGMQKMVDLLYHYAYGGKDLAERFERIPLTLSPDLCVAVQNGSLAPGTRTWLAPCDGSTGQQWRYDRLAGTITNPASGLCLDVFGESLDPGGAVGISPCVDTADGQRWTYDPEFGHLQNALNNVLSAGDASLADVLPPTSFIIPGVNTLLVSSMNFGVVNRERWAADQCVGAECDCTPSGVVACALESAWCERIAERDLCRWSAATVEECASTPGIWTTSDSGFALRNPGAVLPGATGSCITQARNLRQNLSVRRPTFETPVYPAWDPALTQASNAVDGNRDGNYYDGSVATMDIADGGPWWGVDLGSVRRIREVNLYNRTDCCASRLSHYQVWISSDSTDGWNGTWQLAVDRSSTVIADGDTSPQMNLVDLHARWVDITIADTNYLSLAEVEVLGW